MKILRSLEDRFYEKFIPDQNSGCWIWIAALDSDGYGVIYERIGRSAQIQTKAHIVSYRIHHGEIPRKKYILHKCDIKNCVHPDHIYAGTHQQNMKDKAERSLYRGENHVKSIFKNDDVRNIKALLKRGFSCAYIGRLYKVPAVTIVSIKIERTWRHIK